MSEENKNVDVNGSLHREHSLITLERNRLTKEEGFFHKEWNLQKQTGVTWSNTGKLRSKESHALGEKK